MVKGGYTLNNEQYENAWFEYRKKLWQAIDECDDKLQSELKECNPEFYDQVMDELKSIRNIKWINV